MTVKIPRCKADMEKRYERHEWLPALNVKVHAFPEWTHERIVAEFNCSQADAEYAAECVHEALTEQFWNYEAQECLNYIFCGGDGSERYKPAGTEDPPYKVYSDGRMGGWLVVHGMPALETWDARMFQKWRKYARTIREAIAYNLTWEAARELIDANEWATTATRLAYLRRCAIAAGYGEVVR